MLQTVQAAERLKMLWKKRQKTSRRLQTLKKPGEMQRQSQRMRMKLLKARNPAIKHLMKKNLRKMRIPLQVMSILLMSSRLKKKGKRPLPGLQQGKLYRMTLQTMRICSRKQSLRRRKSRQGWTLFS